MQYMPWQQRVWGMIGRPVGISFRDGTGASGVLCEIRAGKLYVLEYMYRNQFATKQYDFNMIQDVNTFPPCGRPPGPPPRPRPPRPPRPVY